MLLLPSWVDGRRMLAFLDRSGLVTRFMVDERLNLTRDLVFTRVFNHFCNFYPSIHLDFLAIPNSPVSTKGLCSSSSQ